MRKIILLSIIFWTVASLQCKALTNKPLWTVNPAAFEFEMEVTCQLFLDVTPVSSGGLVGAFIDGVLQGVKEAGVSGPSGKYVFITRIYNTTASGKTITFKFYDNVRDKVYNVTETLSFIADGITGNAISPVVFHYVPGKDATLSDLKVNGNTVSGFNNTVMAYDFKVPAGTSVIPIVTATTTDPNATKIIQHSGSLPGTTNVIVTSDDGSTTRTYIVNFLFPSSDATLKELKVDAKQIGNFSPSRLLYNYFVLAGTIDIPTVTAVPSCVTASVMVTPATTIPGVTKIQVIAEDGITSKNYEITFVFTSAISLDIDFHSGWNIFSVNNNPVNTDLKAIFQPLINNGSLIKIQDETGKSMEDFGIFGGWVNNIGDILPSEGYKIKVSVSCQFTITGVPAELPNMIHLKTGWNIIGFPHTSVADGMAVVQQLLDHETLIKVQDETGNAIEDWGVFGGWQNGIGNFKPGEGYKIKVNANDTLTINEAYSK